MTPAEAAALLTVAAAFDNRKPDVDQARAWALALDDLNYDDCRDAVVAHYRVSRDWMMPADVRDGVKRIRRDRMMAFGALPDPPRDIDPDDIPAMLAWESATRRAIADGTLTRDAPEPLVIQSREEAEARVKEIRATLARREPEPERPTLDELAAPAAATDAERMAAARPDDGGDADA